MIISTKGVELTPPADYIQKEGKFTLRIEKLIDDGFTTDGHAKFKLVFQGVEVGTKEPIYSHSEMFNVGQSSLWRIKQLEVALKAPECYDINDFIGRYVIANIKSRTYNKKDGSVGTSYQAKEWEYSTHNDKLPPIPEAKQNEDDGTPDISEDELPFLS